jgi:membrane protein
VASLGFGIVFLLWSSSGVFGAVRNGLNATAHARAERPFWRGKLIDLALVVFAGALVSLSVAATATARLLVGRLDDGTWLFVGRERALQVIGLGAAPVVTFVMFFVLYRVTPAVRPAWRDTIAAAVLATVLFEVAKNVVALVIAQSSFTRDTAIYAGVGSALAFLLWMYINGSILLLGAEFGRALRARRERAGMQALPPEAVAAWGGHGDAATFTTSKLQK